MTPSRSLALALVTALTTTMFAATAAHADPAATLVVHYTDFSADPDGAITGVSMTGSAPVVGAPTQDDYGQQVTITYPDVGADGALGFTVTGDSQFPTDTRYVWAEGTEAEVWVVDGDPRAYTEPQAIPAADLTRQGRNAYVPVAALAEVLGLTFDEGTNGYVFDGHPSGTIDILTIYRGRDYYEIAVDSNRIGSNVTGNMLSEYADLVFDDVDGYLEGDDYYLSFGAIERIFQVRTQITEAGAFVLVPQPVAHDQLQTADPTQVAFDVDRLAELDSFAQQQVDDGASALAVVVTKDGKTVLDQAWGYAQRYSTGTDGEGSTTPAQLLPQDQWVPATSDTLFDLASNSKMYATNYAIQRLVSQGRLDLDQTLQSFPGWEDFTDASSDYTGKWTVGGTGGITQVHVGKQTITIADILHHNAGLIPDPEYPNLTSAGDLWYQTDDPDDRTGIVDAISRTPLMYAPRTTFAYSDVDYMILGLLVEQISGQRLDVYLEENFYGPLGLDSTMFRPLENGVDPDRIAATELNGNTRDGFVSFGTFDDGTQVPIRDYTLRGEVHDEKAFYSMAGIAGHAGLFSTTGDMAVLTQLMLNGGIYDAAQYFDRDVATEFTTPYSLDPGQLGSSTIGLGWRLHSANAAAYYYFNWGPSRSTYGHQGWTGTLTIIDPVHQMTITILTSYRHSPVVTPPNGFEGGQFAVSDLVPVSAYVYRALTGTQHQYQVADSVDPVAAVEVPLGTSEADAVTALPATTLVRDTEGGTHEVALTWTLSDYQADRAGDVPAQGTFALPATVIQDDQAQPTAARIALSVSTVVRVLPGEVPTDPGTTEPTDPGASDPGDPASTDPGTSDPGTSDSATANPADPSGPAQASSLPSTGISTTPGLLLAAVAILGGLALLVARRRRMR